MIQINFIQSHEVTMILNSFLQFVTNIYPNMVKHLYFNPQNFDQLILSGILIQIFKEDIQIHAEPQAEVLKFVQGNNIIENSIEAILRFSNNYTNKKIFGKNTQQQAIVTMLNGVCKDIQAKLATSQHLGEEIKEKISYLNQFWKKTQNSWLKKKFLFCHMNMLTLSFKIQEKNPQILSKYAIFVDFRRLFIEKLIDKDALKAMFTSSFNKYQQFDLFPELQAQNGVKEAIQTYQQRLQTIKSQQVKQENQIHEALHSQKTIQASDLGDKTNQAAIEQKIIVQKNQLFDNKPQQLSHVTNNHLDDKHKQNHLTKKVQIQTKIQKMVELQVKGDETKVQEATFIEKIKQTLEQTAILTETQAQEPVNQLQNSQQFDMKKLLKESFSEHLTRPLEYSTRSLADQKRIQQDQKEQKNHTKEEKNTRMQEKKQNIQLKQEGIIDLAESQKYVSQQNIEQIDSVKTKKQTDGAGKKNEITESPSKSKQASALAYKSPQSQSSKAGPRSQMQHKSKVNPKQQQASKDRQTCKCSIY